MHVTTCTLQHVTNQLFLLPTDQRSKTRKIRSKWEMDVTLVKSYLILLSNINKSRQDRFHFDLISDFLDVRLRKIYSLFLKDSADQNFTTFRWPVM